MTPSQRHSGNAIEICRHWARVYELARQRHPLRWSGTTRCWHQPEVVWINPPPPKIGINPAKLVGRLIGGRDVIFPGSYHEALGGSGCG